MSNKNLFIGVASLVVMIFAIAAVLKWPWYAYVIIAMGGVILLLLTADQGGGGSSPTERKHFVYRGGRTATRIDLEE